MHAQIQIFLSDGGGGGGGVQAQRGENSLDFYMYVLGFFSPNNSGDASNYLRGGGGVQMLISVEFDRTCDLPGMGSGALTPPPPPPPSGSAHA